MTPATSLQSPPTVQPTRVRYSVLGWLCSLSMITYIDRVCIMQVQDDMQRDLGLTQKEFSWAFSAFALAYAAFEVPTGWLGDKLGPRKVLIRIVLCWLLFTALTGLIVGTGMTALLMLLSVRFLFGAGEAGAYPNIARAARNWFPFAERGRAQGWIWAFGRWGGAIAPMLIIALTLPFDSLGLQGWRFGFILIGLIGMVWLLGFARSFRETPGDHPNVNSAELEWIERGGASNASKPAPLSWKSILNSRTLWMLSIMYFCSNAGWSFFITYVKKYLQGDLGWSGWQLHLASGMPLLFGGIGCLLGGLLTDRQVRVWGRRWGRTGQGVIAYSLGGALFLLALYLTDINPLLAFAALCFASFVKDFAMGASWATTIDIGHRYSGTVAGLMNTVGNLGTVVSAPLVAQIVLYLATEPGGDWSISLLYYASMFFIAAVCWFFIDPRHVIVYAKENHQRLKAEGVIK